MITNTKMEDIKMLKYIDKGHMVEVMFPKEEKYNNYSVECRYQYLKDKEKYLVSMWLKRKDTDDMFKLEYQHIDTQLLSGDKFTIRQNICRVIEQAASVGYFDEYLIRFDYAYKCFEVGNSYFEFLNHAGEENAS